MTLFWAAAALPGLIALGWLLRVPSEPEAALFLGFSPLRLLLAGGVLFLVLVFAGFAWMAATRPPAWQRLERVSERFFSAPVRAFGLLVMLVALSASALALLALMVSSAAEHSRFLTVAADRAGVVIVWFFLLFAQLSGLVYFTLHRRALSDGTDSSLPRPLWLPLAFAVAVVFIAALRIHTSISEPESDWLLHLSLLLLFGVPSGWVVARLVSNRETAAVFTVWAAVLFVGGALFWAWFINFGEGPFVFHDWKEVTVPRLIVLQNAFSQGELPLHISVGPALLDATDRYMGVPDLILAPQVLLLKWMAIGPFLVVNLLLVYAAGFAGLITFARRYRLSVIAFTLLFLLFNFNGHVVAHIAVGQYVWATAYLLLPWLIVLVFRLFEEQVGWRWVLQTSGLLFLLFLNGGYHYLVYALFLLGLIAILIPRHFWWTAKVLLFTLLLCAVRLLPLAVTAGAFSNNVQFLAGFSSVWRVAESLTQISLPHIASDFAQVTDNIWPWEVTNYVGLIAAALILYFGIAAVIRNPSNPHRALLLPALVLFVLSFDQVYRVFLFALPIPPITGERVAARFILLALLIVLGLAAIEFQRWYERRQPTLLFRTGCVAAVLLVGHDLWENASYWQVKDLAQIFRSESYYESLLVIANHPDPEYTTALAVGAVISAVTLIVLGYLAWRERRSKTALSTGPAHDTSTPDPRLSPG